MLVSLVLQLIEIEIVQRTKVPLCRFTFPLQLLKMCLLHRGEEMLCCSSISPFLFPLQLCEGQKSQNIWRTKHYKKRLSKLYIKGVKQWQQDTMLMWFLSLFQDIDDYICQAKDKSYDTLVHFGRKGLNVAATAAVMAATKVMQTLDICFVLTRSL